MGIKYVTITNEPGFARSAVASGIDIIFVDLELLGKEERQKGRDTLISRHDLKDIGAVKDAVEGTEILVRINPPYEGTADEVEAVIGEGADIIMLPYFKKADEVRGFLDVVNGRVKTCLLLETKEAVACLDSILDMKGIDIIYVGLNDLHISMKMTFMFEPLADGLIDWIAAKVKAKGIKFGFGGISRLGTGDVPAELIMSEHVRIDSDILIIARSFYRCSTENSREEMLQLGLKELMEEEAECRSKEKKKLEQTRRRVVDLVEKLK